MSSLNESHVVGLYDLSKLTRDELMYLVDQLRERNAELKKRLDELKV